MPIDYNFILELAKGNQKERIHTCGGLEHELVEGHALATGFGDSGTSSLSEAESRNSQLWYFINSLIISHSSDDDHSAVSTGSNSC